MCYQASTSSRKGSDQYPISQVTLVQYQNNIFKPLGKLINGGA